MEYWDIYDEHRIPTGKLHLRGRPLETGERHIVVEIWTANPKKQLLITKRHPDKKYGGLWECTGGSALAGEDSLHAAARELFEETGINQPIDMLVQLATRIYPDRFVDTYFTISNLSISDLHLQPEEVVDAQWVYPDQLFQIINEKSFSPSSAERFGIYTPLILDKMGYNN